MNECPTHPDWKPTGMEYVVRTVRVRLAHLMVTTNIVTGR